MEIFETGFEGLLVIKPKVFEDERGNFFELFNWNKTREIFSGTFVQDNIAVSHKNVLRGLHFQNPPFVQTKLVNVIKGSVLDVVVDLRKNSATYKKYFKLEISDSNKLQLLVPPGFAHGYLSLQAETIFFYKVSSIYNKNSEGCLKWNDPELDIEWNISSPILSLKDNNAIFFKDFNNPF